MHASLLDIAKNLIANKKLNEAEQYLLQIDDHNTSIIAEKLYFLGFIKLEQKHLYEAEKYYKKIQKQWSLQFYAQAIYDLGVLKEIQSNIVSAQSYWESLIYDWHPEVYASARLNLGALAMDEGNPNLAQKYWLEIESAWAPHVYVKAQFNLGKLKLDNKDYKNASVFFQKITPEIDTKTYTAAILQLITIAFAESNYPKIIEYSLTLKYEWDPVSYTASRKALLIISTKYIKLSEWELAHSYLRHIDVSEILYEKDCLQLIIDQKKTLLLNIYNKVNEIKDALLLTQGNSNYYCRNIAHYTSSNTALKILSDSNNHKYSPFRLSSIEFMNDPKEGSIIYEWLNVPLPENYRSSCAFASCFSFNHDSLNQFRLYGKQNNIETTGVSVVFDLDFFLNTQSSSTHIIRDSKKTISKEITSQFSKYPLYRCIYFDPGTQYFKVAKRSEYSFYKELEDIEVDKLEVILAEYQLHSTVQDNIFTQNISDDSIEIKKNDSKSIKINKLYKYYLNSIESGEKELNNLISELKQKIQSIDQKNPNLMSILHELLLPLRYLIKHPAFEEEQECRMIAILPLGHEKINSDPDNKFFYINYDVPTKKYVNKVYLGEGAKSLRVFFEHTLSDAKKIKSSKNPFRIK